jgi:hypothetical protein
MLSRHCLLGLLGLNFEQERAVDVWQDTTERDGGANQRIELLVTADGEQQMTRGDALDLEILGGVAGEFQHFSSKVFEHGSQVDGGFGSDAGLLAGNATEMTLDTSARELR